MATLLSVRDVTLRFGGIVALDGVSFDVEAGQISGLIGPNGAGKTTAFNVITRLYTPDSGEITFDGASLLKTPAFGIVERGIARTFQNINLFTTMSRARERARRVALARPRVRASRTRSRRSTTSASARGRAQPAAALPYGIQKRVEIARALAAKPRLLLLDEPAGGLNHEEVEELGDFILRLRDDHDLTILLVEHHMSLVMRISDHVNVLSFGRKIADGTPAEVRAEPGRDRGVPRERRRVTALLELRDVEARYGPVQALRGVSITVPEGAVVAVLGANGAGKTTTLRAVSGTVRRSGEIVFQGKPLRGGPGGGREGGHRPRPGGARHVHRALRGREPAARRLHAAAALAEGGHRPDGRRTSPGSPSAASSGRARSRAASSRCSRSPVL